MVTRVSTGSPFEATFGYSRAVRHRDTIYVSGTTGYDYKAMTMPDDAGVQAANALKTIGEALHQLGSDLKDVVRVTYYVANRADIEKIVAAVGPVFAETRPAATMVLAEMIEEAMKVEIEVTARIGAQHS
jgi:enamine deaminase RidA (YjgF/YER057c/UK114 family)